MAKLFKRVRFMFHVKKFIPFLFAYFRSQNVSTGKKLFAIILMIGYLFFPFDLIPDFLLFFGILDDVAVLAFIMQLIVKDAPDELKERYGVID